MQRRPFTDPQPTVLIANEPQSYRDLLASELPGLRPQLVVLAIDPAELDAAMQRYHPTLVICNRLTRSLQAEGAAAIVLYPNGEDRAFLELAGVPREIATPRLKDLLTAIDLVIAATESGSH